MNKLKISNYILGVLLISSTLSCKDFLDREPTSYSSSGFYQSEAAVEDGVSGVYASLNINLAFNLPFNIMLDHWTGFAFERAENTTIGAGGSLNPDNASVSQWWTASFNTVSRANAVLVGAEPYLDKLEGKSKQYLAEARVLRAFAYCNLVTAFGKVPLFEKPVSQEDYNVERTNEDVIVDFLLADLDACLNDLPWIAENRGRVDRAVAYGIKARLALLAGSLNFGGKGPAYYKIAAESAQAVIGQRQLAANFEDLFNKAGQQKADVRNESLFEIIYSDKGIKKTHMIGFGQVSRNYGQTGRHPSQILADTYECKDGLRIDESPLYDPKKPWANRDPRFRYTLWMHKDTVEGNTNGTETGRVKMILDVYQPTTQIFNFATQTWNSGVNADINSGAAWTSFANAGVGYMWKKYSNEKVESIGAQTCNSIIMRYPEILLTYAEAKIELNELDGSVYDAINQVRNRSKMPNVSADRIGNQQKMRQLVRRERKVEFALEGLHFSDMRRWKIGDLENEGPSYGYPLPTRAANGSVLQEGYDLVTPDMVPNFKKTARHDLNDIANYDAYKSKLKVRDLNRFWDDKFYLFPIPQRELDLAPALGQNDGY
ncbi:MULTISPECIES: RagB/SusD family nutrient uptake outer membrane protein [Sphingobacterium]|uniref:RagB/SusD family nutrient uptake outer membrane protein n=1 Tax=Sphingobacterium hotanense TaxID=649196 RepID=A0ABT7NRI8_9SPHI|nr:MULTISPECIES: RagB/SusD family nutrient uptake outer membrane protein [Sphingobacterium]MDM1049832.1 RagB/SusD family nutrient uptake outer membrane protein [Sphingobacterium hotanense]